MLRFDGRVAVVTGAGRGIGRAHALLLAARGASVVVNDLDEEPASAVVAEITATGGSAVASVDDISTSEGGAALVAAALQSFGRLDALVNNAGNIRWAGPPEVDEANLRAHLDVHLLGSFHTIRAAWPTFVEQGHGRIVNTTSAGVLGLPKNLGYAAAKGGVIGLTRSLAVAGAAVGIKVNALAPAAATRMGGRPGDEVPMAPELAAPMAAFLAHEDCPVTGEVYFAGAGRFSRLVLATTPGVVLDEVTPEALAERWDEVNALDGLTVPAGLMEWSGTFLSHLPGA